MLFEIPFVVVVRASSSSKGTQVFKGVYGHSAGSARMDGWMENVCFTQLYNEEMLHLTAYSKERELPKVGLS